MKAGDEGRAVTAHSSPWKADDLGGRLGLIRQCLVLAWLSWSVSVYSFIPPRRYLSCLPAAPAAHNNWSLRGCVI